MPDPLARIYEIFPLLCPICAGQMRIIAFSIFSAKIRQILEYIKVDCEPPHIAPASGPPLSPLWEGSKPEVMRSCSFAALSKHKPSSCAD